MFEAASAGAEAGAGPSVHTTSPEGFDAMLQQITRRAGAAASAGAGEGEGSTADAQTAAPASAGAGGDDAGEAAEEEQQEEGEPKPLRHQAVATLGIALIAMGEEIGSEMALRQFQHLVSHLNSFVLTIFYHPGI